MNVGLVDVDSKIPNVALMKLSAFHKQQGDHVKFYEPLLDETPDLIYASKIYGFSPDYDYFPECEIVKGGPGYSLTQRLPDEVDIIKPDYDLYGGCAYSIGRFTRGCPNRCPWCVVWRMDGTEVREIAKLTDWWDERHDTVRVLDDNIMIDGDIFCRACEQISDKRLKAIWEALDIRLVTKDTAKALASVRRVKDGCLHFAWDSPAQEHAIGRGIRLLNEAGIKSRYLVFYVLVGFNTTPEYDMYRIRTLWEGYGAYPFVMPFNKEDRYQRDLARWCNNRALFKSMPFEEYRCQTNKNA